MIKILIIKLGALGDVIRTTPILESIKEKYKDSEIYWLTKKESKEILENNSHINKILTLPYNENNIFDILYNFDIDEEATKLALNIKANKKYGFYYNDGYPSTFNLSAEYYLNTLFDDELKKNNKKTYQEMIFEVAELPYKKQLTMIYLNENDKKYAQDFIGKNNIKNRNLIGIHIGASSRWPSKSWHESKIKEFIKKLIEKNYNIILFAGLNEKDKQEKIIRELNNEGINICYNDPSNSMKQFASLVGLCKIVVCSDSFALHVSLALKIKTIVLFFCSSPDEIEGYGKLKKVVSPLLYNFFPERMNEYDEELVNSISVEEVLNAIKI